MKPSLGRIVLYRTDARNGLVYDLPAMITCTQASHPGDYPDGRTNPLPVPFGDTNVHLTVYTPGGVGTLVIPEAGDSAREPYRSEDFVGAHQFIPGSGTYVELNVPFWDPEEHPGEPLPRSWRWPERTS